MAHARLALLQAIVEALADASPSRPVYLEDQTATDLPCFQVAFDSETLGDSSGKLLWERSLTFKVTARAATVADREDLCEELERALIVADVDLGAFEVVLVGVEFTREGAEGGQRNVTATYTLVLSYFNPRADPSSLES